ncbi:hypothetical protein [Dictyobacter vulcani]|uniref:hypothetical protein n=1 Tax=Dictyobacter vulcani TaxID=2607529 RepID=UPI001386C59B|nr:hypothetical protein [Dictyobacter vulcani]
MPLAGRSSRQARCWTGTGQRCGGTCSDAKRLQRPAPIHFGYGWNGYNGGMIMKQRMQK